MDVKNRNATCNNLFWIKTGVAISIALTAIIVQIVVIVNKHQYALDHPFVAGPKFDFSTSNCTYSKSSTKRNRLEPPDGSFLWGFHLDFSTDTVPALLKRVQFKPAVINGFFKMTATDFEVDTINWIAQQAGDQNAILELTLDPVVDLSLIPDSLYLAFALQMAHINQVYGCPVFLRFMHEMNGNWDLFGQAPVQFLKAFKTMAVYIHNYTNMTAMVWAPNVGGGYPYSGKLPTDPANAALLDTNKDGRLTHADLPFAPYWPGPEYVDWIGISSYSIRVDGNYQTAMAEPTDLIDSFTTNAIEDLYHGYSYTYNKPFMLGETASSYSYNLNTTLVRSPPNAIQEMHVKQSWWRAILQYRARYPLWKSATWFEEMKSETSRTDTGDVVWQDYRITFNSTVVPWFLSDLNSATYGYGVVNANQLKYDCKGTVNVG